MSWILVFVLGIIIINLIAIKLTFLEKIGFAMPIGLGVNTFILILLDFIGFAINNQGLIISINVILSLVFLGVFYWKNQDFLNEIKEYKPRFDTNQIKNINLNLTPNPNLTFNQT